MSAVPHPPPEAPPSQTARLACFDTVLALPPCRLGVREAEGAIIELVYLSPDTPTRQPETAAGALVAAALARYLADPSHQADLPFTGRGTSFQRAVWAAISRIPSGHVRRYGDIAEELSGAARAVGQACGANPFPPFVPCHRVVGGKSLGGFAHHSDGWLIDTKQWLLRHEGALLL
ncbi:MGMT family protein [Niveibacterium sp. SC-1]|uniref:methylated-DNA--[protein]-cysteine S-methyltransferase n=1 Tax=Niveibacterium sp. SC-1 TaxID=3135646 RepID=UPI00311F19F8